MTFLSKKNYSNRLLKYYFFRQLNFFNIKKITKNINIKHIKIQMGC